jgi:outer membrane protein OmpA-like peptidoglycan-associated protein
MTRRQTLLGSSLAAAILAGLVLPLPAIAGDLTAQQITEGLKVSRTRSLSGAAKPSFSPAELDAINKARSRTRSLSAQDRTQIAEIASKRPKINLDVTFEYNSAALTAQAEPQLDNLGKALTGADLAGAVIMLGGHTDAKGGATFNQQLSEKRAEAVKTFLVSRHKIAPDTLITAGYGKKGLKNPNDPFASENRRVEIVNLAEREEASAAARQ